jgi:hypothetical protein
MATNKAPRKKYRPKPVVRPLNLRNAWLTEGDCHALLLAIEGKTFAEQHLADLVVHADMTAKIAQRRRDLLVVRHANALLRLAITIQARNQERGILAVSTLEETAIRASMEITLPFIRGATNLEILTAAEAGMRRHERRAA